MYKLRPFLPLKVMRNVCYSLLYSHMIYAIEAWGSAFKTELEKILVLQKRAMRLMTFNDADPTVHGPLISSDPIFSKLETLNISDGYKYQVSKFIFKCVNNIASMHFQNWFVLSHKVHGYHTRSNINITAGTKINHLFIPSARTTNYGLKQLKVNGPPQDLEYITK